MFAATIGMFASMTLALGLLLAFTPYLMRRNECFAVTVPAAAQTDPRIIALKKRYATVMLALTVAATVVSLIAGVLIASGGEQAESASALAGSFAECAAILVLIVVSFALMLRNRRTVMSLKRQEGWSAARTQTAAVVAETDLPGALPLTWNLLYIPVILGTLALGLALYPHMPDMLPMHADLNGTVTHYEPKSLGIVIGFPVLIEVFLAACFTFCHWMMLRSKRPTDPAAPATSALAYGLFARAQSVFLLIIGMLLGAGIGILFTLSSAGFIGLEQAGIVIVVLCIPIVVGSIALSVVYGQAGSRVFKRMQGDAPLLADDDEHWKLGLFYVNRDDASLFLPERFGIGWTMNFARPVAWAIIVGGAALTATFIVAIALLVS